jgi:hypothetical protein
MDRQGLPNEPQLLSPTIRPATLNSMAAMIDFYGGVSTFVFLSFSAHSITLRSNRWTSSAPKIIAEAAGRQEHLSQWLDSAAHKGLVTGRASGILHKDGGVSGKDRHPYRVIDETS